MELKAAYFFHVSHKDKYVIIIVIIVQLVWLIHINKVNVVIISTIFGRDLGKKICNRTIIVVDGTMTVVST